MKTLELKLKKDVLIVDLEDDEAGFINGNYDFLCDGSELTEEIASELVEMEYSVLYKKSFFIDYDRPSLLLKFAKESFISAVESKGFYWLDNPISDPNKIIHFSSRKQRKILVGKSRKNTYMGK